MSSLLCPCIGLVVSVLLASAGRADEPQPAPPTAPEAAPAEPAATSTDAPAAQDEAPASPAAPTPAASPPASDTSASGTKPAAPATPAAAPRPRNVITLNVPANIFGAYSIEGQRVLSDHVSLFAEPTFFNLPPIEGVNLGITGPGLVFGVMIHPFGTAPDGFFVAPEAYLTYLDSAADDARFALGGGVGAATGWTFRFFDFVVLSLGVGGTVNGLGYNLSGGEGYGFLPVVRANLGVAF